MALGFELQRSRSAAARRLSGAADQRARLVRRRRQRPPGVVRDRAQPWRAAGAAGRDRADGARARRCAQRDAPVHDGRASYVGHARRLLRARATAEVRASGWWRRTWPTPQESAIAPQRAARRRRASAGARRSSGASACGASCGATSWLFALAARVRRVVDLQPAGDGVTPLRHRHALELLRAAGAVASCAALPLRGRSALRALAGRSAARAAAAVAPRCAWRSVALRWRSRWRARRRSASGTRSRRCCSSTSRRRSATAQLDAARALVDEARAARHGDDGSRLVTFGRPSAPGRAAARRRAAAGRRARAPRRRRGQRSRRPRCTLAYGLYPPGTLPRALLVSDGNETEGDLAAEAAEAARRGVRVSTSASRARRTDEVLVRALTLPERRQGGRAVRGHRRGLRSRAQTATLTLYRDEFVNPLDGRKTRARCRPAPTSSSGRPRWRRPGFTTFKAVGRRRRSRRCRSASRQQRGASRRWRSRASRACSTSRASRRRRRYLANALERENIDVDVRASYGLPSSPRSSAPTTS